LQLSTSKKVQIAQANVLADAIIETKVFLLYAQYLMYYTSKVIHQLGPTIHLRIGISRKGRNLGARLFACSYDEDYTLHPIVRATFERKEEDIWNDGFQEMPYEKYCCRGACPSRNAMGTLLENSPSAP
jgi:hypothetical protein